MKQDYWFEPGDKVMRVAYGPEVVKFPSWQKLPPNSEKGKVLCVHSCWQEVDGWNRVLFVGIPIVPGSGFLAACFRRVEEIKLCVKAAQKVGEPVEVEPEFSQAPENIL